MNVTADTVIFDPDCSTCGGTLHPCECHILGLSDHDDIHPPHGRPFWEWRGLCPRCHPHQWFDMPGTIPSLIQCAICKVMRDAPNDEEE